MSRPKAYDPQDGFKYQILCRCVSISREWEHCDYATDATDRKHLITNYRQAYGTGWEFQTITLPRKHWPKPVKFRNSYECSECGHKWEDVWTCQCNDRCPKCNIEIQPSQSVEVAA